MVDKAVNFATKAHEGQVRKGTNYPYIIHPLEVGKIVSTMTDDEEVVSAAILHDTIEDCEGVSKEVLEKNFGKRVADLVSQESENKTKTWIERKGTTVCHIKDAPREVKMIALADKLSNLRDINNDYQKMGESLWNKFHMKKKKMIGWYYRGMRNALSEEFQGVPAYEEFSRLVDKIFD